MLFRIVMILSVAALVGGCQPPMQDFTSTEWKFKARFPGKPQMKKQSEGELTLTAFLTESNNGVNMVGVADVPLTGMESDAEIQTRLDMGRDEAIRRMSGKLTSSKQITLDGKYPGREFVATITKPVAGQLRAKIYIVEKRLYEVMVLGTNTYATSSNTEEFLNSFQLLK